MQLRDYPFFRNLSDNDFALIEDAALPVTAPTGTILYYQGDVTDGILFLKRGMVKVYLQPESVSASEVTLYHIHPGEQCLVNTVSTITENKTLASALVMESIEGWMIPRSTMRWLIAHSPEYRDYKITLCSQRLGDLVTLISSLKFEQLDQRSLNWLYVQGLDIIRITHEKLASFLGVSREAVSRNLKKLEQSGAVKLARGAIILT
jgi:CRP/FNR family transcriptional regulator